MANARQALFQRISSSLIIPITILPLAAILLAVGTQLQIHPLQEAGVALVRTWLPLFYGIGVSIGFTGADAMGTLSVVSGYVVMVSVAEAVSGDPALNIGVLGGLSVGVLCTWLYNRVRHVDLPEFLALFSGKRLGPIVSSAVGVVLGYLFGMLWPSIQWGIVSLGYWIYNSGAIGAFTYGVALRLLLPTGMHHILMQLVDTQVGGWIDPISGKLVAGEYLRFLAGDPSAGYLMSGFFLTLNFAPVGIALALTREALADQRKRVSGMMTTAVITAVVLGVTEPIEFAFLFASPVLFVLHVFFAGLASMLGWFFQIRLGGYALSMLPINWHLSENGWLLFPLGLAYIVLYYYSFRAVIRWLKPPVLGRIVEEEQTIHMVSRATGSDEGYLRALGGSENIVNLEACMTRLRVVLRDPDAVSEEMLTSLGATQVLRHGGGAMQIVVGARAGKISEQIRQSLRTPLAPDGAVLLYSPLSGRVLPLPEVPDSVFAQKMVGDGLAIAPSDGLLLAPVFGRVTHIFPGGHALAITTPEGIEVLIHIGIDTVSLKGEGFTLYVSEGTKVSAGQKIGRFDLALIAAHGKSLVTPVLILNPDRLAGIEPLQSHSVKAGQTLMRLVLPDS